MITTPGRFSKDICWIKESSYWQHFHTDTFSGGNVFSGCTPVPAGHERMESPSGDHTLPLPWLTFCKWLAWIRGTATDFGADRSYLVFGGPVAVTVALAVWRGLFFSRIWIIYCWCERERQDGEDQGLGSWVEDAQGKRKEEAMISW